MIIVKCNSKASMVMEVPTFVNNLKGVYLKGSCFKPSFLACMCKKVIFPHEMTQKFHCFRR